jgi:prevent-host-death family protein
MSSVGVHEAKTHLSRILRRVRSGEEIVITSSGRPVAKIVPISDTRQRVLGIDEGVFEVPEDFNDALPRDLLDEFET